MKKQEGAVITVYLTLILGILLSLILSLLEGARVSSTKVLLNRITQTALQSKLSDYYLPLFDHYHIYGLRLKGEELSAQSELENALYDEISMALSPPEHRESFLLCDPSICEIQVTKTNDLIDSKAAEFIRQALAYEKYNCPAQILEQTLEAFQLIDKSNASSEILLERLKIEQTLLTIDQNILNLVKLIEGLQVSNQMIEQTFHLKRIKTTDYFLKKHFPNSTKTQDALQINNDDIYDALKGKYNNICKDIALMIESGDGYYKQGKLFGDQSDPKTVMQLNSSIEILAYKEIIDFQSIMIQRDINILLQNSKAALKCINEIRLTQEEGRKKLSQFKTLLEEKKESLTKEYYEDSLSSIENMVQYTDNDSKSIGMIYDINAMETTIKSNMTILSNIKQQPAISFSVLDSEYQQWLNYQMYCGRQLLLYEHKGLCFDYSKVQFQKQGNTILSGIKEIICDGITSLVIEDNSKISKRKISGEFLPSNGVHKKTEESDQQINAVLSMNEDDEIQNLYGTGHSYEVESDNISLTNQILFLSYLCNHTSNYQTQDTARKGQMLLYEQEYLLYGNESDEANLDNFLLRLIIVRTFANMIPIMTDRQKVSQAEAFALTTVGFTGLSFLVSIVKYVVLFIWALAQALVETAALLMGYSICLVPSSKDVVITFSDLAILNKNTILSKAKTYKRKSNQIGLAYEHYLSFFILMQDMEVSAYRLMDLIQENIRYEYESDFLLQECITGCAVCVQSQLKPKFLITPYLKDNTVQKEFYIKQYHSGCYK